MYLIGSSREGDKEGRHLLILLGIGQDHPLPLSKGIIQMDMAFPNYAWSFRRLQVLKAYFFSNIRSLFLAVEKAALLKVTR